jgi:hypothetical protein
MDAQPQTQRKGLRRLLQRNSPTTEKPNESSGKQKGKAPTTQDPDTERTIARQEKAYALLLSSLLKSQQDDTWNFLEFSQPEKDARDFDDKFIQKVNEILELRKGEIEDDALWSKCCQTMECIFATLIPLSKNLLTIANPGQSVGPSHSLSLTCRSMHSTHMVYYAPACSFSSAYVHQFRSGNSLADC